PSPRAERSAVEGPCLSAPRIDPSASLGMTGFARQIVFCGSGGTLIVCGPDGAGAGAGVGAGAAEAEVAALVVSTFLVFLWVVPALDVAFWACWAWTRFRHADFEVELFSVLQ